MMRRLFMGFALLASLSVAAPAEAITNGGPEIGRASCRERV